MLYVKREMLKERLVEKKDDEDVGADDEIDYDKTKETFWHLLTGSTS
jgi:hypothetical protein